MSARILVVDDILPNVKLLEIKLTREYFDVVTAFNGADALVVAREQAPDLILLDVMMPEMDGFEVCRRLKADPMTQHIPVVMVTALSDSADRVRGLEVGADDFLTKPVNDTALFARVRSLTRLKMMMDEWRARETTSGELGVLHSRAAETAEAGDKAAVLVVEDSRIDAEKVAESLEWEKDRVSLAHTAEDAMVIGQAATFDLIVISLTMLSEDGLRLCSHLRNAERTRQTPILLMADDADMGRVAKGLEIGANDYLVKPIDRNELLARKRTQVRRKRYQDRLRANYEMSLSMALTDGLTGLFNRRYLSTHLARTIQRIAETQKPVSAILFDIDHFKAVNDTHGHDVGDNVLKEVAGRVSRNLRNFDTVARYGGEEFVIVMPDASLEAAALVADRLRQQIASEPFDASKPAEPLTVTISLGVAMTQDPASHPDDLLRNADRALYDAKRAGRNRVAAYGGDNLPPGIMTAG